MYYYAFTIRCMSFIRLKPTYSLFESIIEKFKAKYNWVTVEWNLEVKQKKNGNHNVHVHGMVSTPKKVIKRMLESVTDQGYTVTQFEYVKSQSAWKAYRTKGSHEMHLETLASLLEEMFNQSDGDELITDYCDQEDKSIMDKLKRVRIV